MSTSAFLFRLVIFLLIVLLVDIYVFKGVKTAVSGAGIRVRQVVKVLYWLVDISFIAFTLYVFLSWNRNENPRTGLFVLMAGSFVLIMVPKLIFAVILLFEDIVRLFHAIGAMFANMIGWNNGEKYGLWFSRRTFVSQIGLAIAAIPFAAVLYGILKGRYNFKVHKVEVAFDDLPEEFDGFTITQISDVHSGSFDDLEKVQYGLDLAQEQGSDLFVFTGDLVNNMTKEVEPFIEMFSKLSAPFGKFSITGNHDYGDYTEWPTARAKEKNFEDLKVAHQKMGFELLLNQNVKIKKGDSEISLIGIENWGRGRFSKYGDLDKALEGVDSNAFKLLLSHDPSHWDDKVIGHDTHIHLALAGHTHGMQFGIEIPGIKWSPSKYRYRNWAGLHKEKGKYLYVNRGFGYIAFPGRVGIWPEVTHITLRKA